MSQTELFTIPSSPSSHIEGGAPVGYGNGPRPTKWVPYEIASRALGRLNEMLDGGPVHRPPCLLIHGDTNNGKTLIARKFFKDRQGSVPENADGDTRPILFLQTPPQADFGTLLSLILWKLNAPMTSTANRDKRTNQVLTLLTAARVRMLILDEIHHILISKMDQRTGFLNGLKFLSNELQISIVLIGTVEAVRAVQTDQQHGNRFEPFHVPRWENGDAYAAFLAGCAQRLGFPDVEPWRQALPVHFHAMSEGLTGETWRLMCKAGEVARHLGQEVIDERVMTKVDWRRPSDRRKFA